MFAQHPAQPHLFANFDGTKAHGVLVVTVASNRISQQIRQAARHARAQVHSSRAQNHSHARGHIFTSVLANAFDYGESAAVADCKSFAHASRDV